MSKTLRGQCACGDIRFEASGDPVAELHCQCRDCRFRSGTGHSSYLVFDGPQAVRVNGQTKIWSVAADSGAKKYQAFCPNCGTPIHVTFPANPDVTAISAGLLDEPDSFSPGFVTYACRALPWDDLNPELTRFDKLPPN